MYFLAFHLGQHDTIQPHDKEHYLEGPNTPAAEQHLKSMQVIPALHPKSVCA